MLKFIKGITATVLSCFFILTTPVYASINTTSNEDNVLLNSGTPKELVKTLSISEKKDLASFIIKEKATFSGSETSRYYFDEKSQQLKLVNDYTIMSEISTADLKLSTNVWTSTTGGTAGNTYVAGMYEWLKSRPTIKDHLFTISMPSGWNVDASTVKKNTWYRLSPSIYEWTIMESVSGRSYSSTENSVTWSSLSNTTLLNNPLLYKGSAHFVARKTSSSASKQVKLQYGYATGTGTIGLSYANFGVTYTGSSGINQASQTFNFN